MKKFSMQLLENDPRPVVKLKDGCALFSTGTFFPVVNLSKAMVENELQGKLVYSDRYIRIGGLGEQFKGDVYRLPTLSFGELLYPNIHVFVPHEQLNLPFPYLISMAMLADLPFSIDNLNKTLTVYIPDGESMVRNLKILDDKGELHVLINGKLVKDGD